MRKPVLKFLSIFLFFVLACGLTFDACSLCAEEGSSKEEEALYVAKKAFEDGFYEVSLGLGERFLKNYPESAKAPEANLLIARCYYQQNRYLDSLNKLEELLKQPAARDIKDAVLYWMAEVHFKGNGFEKAASYYKSIIDSYPKSEYLASAYYSLAWCLFQEEEFKEALVYFKAVEEKFSRQPQAKDAPFKIVECLYNLKDYQALKEKAKDYLKAYARDQALLSYMYFYMAEADYYLNNFSQAVDEYARVVDSAKDAKIKALSQLGGAWSYLKLKRYKEAEDAFSRIERKDLEKRSTDILLLGQAILMSETSRFGEAKNLYSQLLAASNEPLVLMQAYLGKADTLYSLADYAEAVKVYQEAAEKVSAETLPAELSDKLHYSLAWAYLKQGEFKEAIKEFQMIAKESDDKTVKVSALCSIGDTYQDSGDYLKAQEAYDTILKDYPDSFYGDYVQYQLGMTLLKSSNYDGAILSFLTLKRNYPNSKIIDDAAYALGLSYFQKQDYNASSEAFRNFQDDFKESNLKPQALYLLGTSLYNLGKFNEAIEVFKGIARMARGDAELAQKAEYEIADCFYQLGNEKEALSRFNTLRAKYPDSSLTPEIMWWLGEYYWRHNDLSLARRYLSSLIRDYPKSSLIPDAYYALGSSFQEEAKYNEAVENFKKVILYGKTDLTGQALAAIAEIYALQDQPSAALKAYKEIIKEYPNLSSLVYPKIAGILYKTGSYDDALDYYRKALDAAPAKDMAGLQMKLAEVLEGQGKVEQAIEEYLKVTYLYSADGAMGVKALLRVAEIYEKQEDFKEALNFYKKIIALNTDEAKYAQERIDWIRANTGKGKGSRS